MKTFKYTAFVFFIVSCDDIGKGYDWNSEQPTSFSRRYGTLGYDYGWSTAYSPYDEGVVVVGKRSPQINGQSDLWAIKTNSRGILEWETSFGGSGDEQGYDVISTSDGSYLFVGYSWSFGNKQQIYAIKTDFFGNKIWEKTYGGSMWEVGNAVIEVIGGGYVIAGYSNSPGISSGNTDIFLIKIDSNGGIIWEKSYGNRSFTNHEWAYDLVQISDEGFIIVGARDRYGEGSKNGIVLRLDKEGNMVWEKEFIDNEAQVAETIYSISESIDGSLYLCSSINSSSSLDIYQPKIIKIDRAGNIDWQRVFKSDSRKYHQFRATTTRSGELRGAN